MTQFGRTTGPNNLSLFDINGFATVVPGTTAKYFRCRSGLSPLGGCRLGAFNAMMDPATLDAAANLDYQNSGTFEEQNTAGISSSTRAGGVQPTLQPQCRYPLGEYGPGPQRASCRPRPRRWDLRRRPSTLLLGTFAKTIYAKNPTSGGYPDAPAVVQHRL